MYESLDEELDVDSINLDEQQGSLNSLTLELLQMADSLIETPIIDLPPTIKVPLLTLQNYLVLVAAWDRSLRTLQRYMKRLPASQLKWELDPYRASESSYSPSK